MTLTRVLLIIGILVSAVIGYVYMNTRDLHIEGPTSPTGDYLIRFIVSDREENMPMNWGADFYTDVIITDKASNELFKWSDPGRGSAEESYKLMDTVKWTSDHVFTFMDGSSSRTFDVRDVTDGSGGDG